MRALLLCLVFASSSGCYSLRFEDISEIRPHSELVGRAYRVREDLELVGIREDRNDRSGIDYYLILGRPNIAGRYVVERHTLPRGSVLSVVRVMRCTNCFKLELRLVVTVDPDQGTKDVPVFLEDLLGILVHSGDGAPVSPNPELFDALAD